MRRFALGIFAIAFLLGGALLYFLGPREMAEHYSGMALRIGLVLGAGWLAYPQLQYVPWWLAPAALVGVLVVLRYPRAIFVVLPVLFAIWLLGPRNKPHSRKTAPSRKKPARPRPSKRPQV